MRNVAVQIDMIPPNRQTGETFLLFFVILFITHVEEQHTPEKKTH